MPEHGLTLFGNIISVYFYYLRKILLFSENNRNKVPQNIHKEADSQLIKLVWTQKLGSLIAFLTNDTTN